MEYLHTYQLPVAPSFSLFNFFSQSLWFLLFRCLCLALTQSTFFLYLFGKSPKKSVSHLLKTHLISLNSEKKKDFRSCCPVDIQISMAFGDESIFGSYTWIMFLRSLKVTVPVFSSCSFSI